MVKFQPSKLAMRVRFPLPAPQLPHPLFLAAPICKQAASKTAFVLQKIVMLVKSARQRRLLTLTFAHFARQTHL
jgi:hypothetical protein